MAYVVVGIQVDSQNVRGLFASLSGSGSALFGLYLTCGDAEAVQQRIGNQVHGLNVKTTLTRTLPRSAYWDQMLKRS